ncbi:ABI family, member 3 (NESH) binding protein b isoform X2 [Denticeps clupeoides]|uniref:Fibronectin type-III domain-containing protein n=1 Tax=Denticeps clupeoides TaxID=299321 RepID=A0AAY4BKW1_9TELE|nr:target of Nesh-SH3-like isoform X2 [Denticeps clupeoides]
MLQHSALAITQQSKTSKLNNSSPSCEASPASRYEAMDGIALLRTSVLILAGILLFSCISAQRVRVRRQNMKVRINATGDTIVLKFLRPNPDTKLEGYILGYGSSMFSKQFIQLPENGEPYETEIDAEPKYLVAVQPIPTNDVKKQCTGKVNLDKPLHLVIGSLTPTSVLLSWGTFVKTPYEGNIMNDCLEDGYYTIRYRERNRKWNYQTCPTSDTVIDNLKPNTPYEFGIRSNKDDRSGGWSKPVIHNTNMGDKNMQKPFKPSKPVKPVMAGPHTVFPPRVALHNRTQARLPAHKPGFPVAPKTSFAPPMSRQETVPSLNPNEPQWPQFALDTDNHVRNASSHPVKIPSALPHLLPTQPHTSSATPAPKSQLHGDMHQGQTSATQKPHKPSAPVTLQEGQSHLIPGLVREQANKNTWGKGTLRSPASSLPTKPNNSIFTVTSRNMTSPGRTPFSPFTNGMRNPSFPRGNGSAKISMRPGANGEHHKGFALHKPAMWPRIRMGSPVRTPMNIKTNLVGKPGGIDKTNDVKQSDKTTFLQPNVIPAVTAKPAKQERRTTTASPAVNANNFETWENSSVFSSLPASEVDAMGKKRFIAPHVVYKTDKKPDEPCSITTSLTYFPDDEPGEQNVTAPPKTAPSNLTVVTVEGCPSFVILDWEKTDNDTTEYEVISTTKGPDGEQVSILTTDKTHTAVENLRPESSYEFKVKPKNDLGEGPPSEPVSFSTESADPRVSENVSGKDAIWTQFPFKTDSFSECNGKQYVKRTWYRKFVGIQLCNSLRYKIYLSDSLNGKFYNIGDQTGHGEDHCQFVDSFLDGRTGTQVPAADLLARTGFYRAVRQEPVHFGMIGGNSHITYVSWYECGLPIPGKW